MAVVDVHRSALDIAEPLQTIAESGEIAYVGFRGIDVENADTWQVASGSRRGRPNHWCAAKTDYEFSPRDADCHLTRAQRDHARGNVGKSIMPQSGGLA